MNEKFLSQDWFAAKPARPWIVAATSLALGVGVGCLIMWGIKNRKR